MEDWYSENHSIDDGRARPAGLLHALERELLTTSVHATCPSLAMSDALVEEFGCPCPSVVYNAFPFSDRGLMDRLSKDRTDQRVPSVHWFSQTLGRDRGLEDLVAALPLLRHDIRIHLRGNPAAGFEEWLADCVPAKWRHCIVIHQLVPNAELLSRIAEHDIGFSGETRHIPNKDLTVSNKILHYLLAGLAVVASDTAGQREIAKGAPGAVFLYPSGDRSALAAKLDSLLGTAGSLSHAKAAALDAASRTFCWERQEEILLESVRCALGSPVALQPPFTHAFAGALRSRPLTLR
jgi:hypothetical protein